MRYKYVLFDLDGTLTDSAEGIIRSILYALEKHGVKADGADLMQYIGPPLADTFRAFDLPEEKLKDVIEVYRERYNRYLLIENSVFDGIPELLDGLLAAGCRLAVATSKPTVMADRVLEHFGLADRFTLILGSELDGRRTDKGEVIAEVLHRLGDPAPDRVLMIGDRWSDVSGALRCGVDGAGAGWGYGSEEELFSAGAAAVFPTPADCLAALTADGSGTTA